MLRSFNRLCNCRYTRTKLAVWQTVTWHVEGCGLKAIAEETNQPVHIIKRCLEDLHVEEKVYQEGGRWYPEMGISTMDTGTRW